MRGPTILARTLSVPTGRAKNAKVKWQYHSRSDNHSKAACWTLLLDLMIECDVIRSAAQRGRLGFGINHVMVGPINKTLDLVVTIVSPNRPATKRKSFVDLAEQYGLIFDGDDEAVLRGLPPLLHDDRGDLSEVAIAMEAKACMTEHVKSLPRLHAEILATGYLARRAERRCITVSYSLVNAAPTFVTPSSGAINVHAQPSDARRVVDMIANAIPLTDDANGLGYDVKGVTVVDCRNDGSPVTVVDSPPAPQRNEQVHYEWMIRRVCSEFRSRFGSL